MSLKPLIIAHRGFSGKYPENTILAVEKAISFADIVEIDVQLTKDKEVILFHDQTTKRIFPSIEERRIQEMTFKEIRKLDASKWFSSKIEKQQVPTLEEVVELIDNKTSLIIELKNKGSLNEKVELAERVMAILEKKRVDLGKGYISVRDVEMADIIRRKSTSYKIGLMQKDRKPTEFIDVLKKNNVDFAQIRWKQWDEKEWNNLLSLGIDVTAFFADERRDCKYLITKKIYGIFTNFPDKLKKLL